MLLRKPASPIRPYDILMEEQGRGILMSWNPKCQGTAGTSQPANIFSAKMAVLRISPCTMPLKGRWFPLTAAPRADEHMLQQTK